MFDRREVLKGLAWLGGAAVCSIPTNVFASTMPIDQLQRALGFLGYLPKGSVTGIPDEATERALIRFKRHARRAYRTSRTGVPFDVEPGQRFCGEADASITEETVLELKHWVERGWKLPVGRFKFSSLAEPGKPASYWLRWSTLREDGAKAWREVMREALAQGATLAEPYGDTLRPLGFDRKDGVSKTSMHICGRAVDLNQGLAQGWWQRYWVSPEPDGDRMYFRLFCRTAKQDGSQGCFYDSGQVPVWRARLRGQAFLPRGWYVDLTELLAEADFGRVHAREGWQMHDIRSEWWHYHHLVDEQETFLDECELVGITEQRLLAAGYSIEEMDREPG